MQRAPPARRRGESTRPRWQLPASIRRIRWPVVASPDPHAARFQWRSSAEFAKAAMHQQTLRGCDTSGWPAPGQAGGSTETANGGGVGHSGGGAAAAARQPSCCRAPLPQRCWTLAGQMTTPTRGLWRGFNTSGRWRCGKPTPRRGSLPGRRLKRLQACAGPCHLCRWWRKGRLRLLHARRGRPLESRPLLHHVSPLTHPLSGLLAGRE